MAIRPYLARALSFSLAALLCISVSILAAATTKSLKPGKSLEFTNKKADGAFIQTNAEEIGAVLDLVSYPQKGDGDPQQEVSVSLQSLEVPGKGRLMLTLLEQSPGPLQLTFDATQLTCKDAAKPALEHRVLGPGKGLELAGIGTDRTVVLLGPDSGEPLYDMVIYSDKATLSEQVPSATSPQPTVPAKGRLVISVPEPGPSAVEVVFDPQGLKASVPAEPALRRKVLEQGKSLELRSGASNDRTVLVRGEGSLLHDFIIYQGKGKVLQQGRGVGAEDLSLPAKAYAIVTVPEGAEGPVEFIFEGSTIKGTDSNRPAFEYRSVRPGESSELTPVLSDAMVYVVGVDGSAQPYDLSVYRDKGKVAQQQEEGTTAVELTVPAKGRAVLSVPPGAESPLVIAYDPTTLKAAKAASSAFERKVLTTGQSYAFANQTSGGVSVRVQPAGEGEVGPYDLVIYTAKGDVAQLSNATTSGDIYLPSKGKAFVSVASEGAKAQFVWDPGAVAGTESDRCAIERKPLKVGESADIRNLKGVPFELSLQGSDGAEAILDYVVYSAKGDALEEYLSAARSTLQLPGGGRVVLSVPASATGGAQVAFDPGSVSFVHSDKPAIESRAIQPGQAFEFRNLGSDVVTLYTDADGQGDRLLDYALVGPDGFPVQQGFSAAPGQLRLNGRNSAHLSVFQGYRSPVTVTYRPGAVAAEPLSEPAMRRRLVAPGEAVQYTNSTQKRVDLAVTPDLAAVTEATFCIAKADSAGTGATIECIVRGSTSVSVEPGASLGISVPTSSPDAIRVSAYEPALGVKPEALAITPIFPSGTVTLQGSLRAPVKLRGFSLVVSGGANPAFSQVVLTASVPQATDVNLAKVSYQPKGGYLLSGGDYTLALRGDRADGSGELDLAKWALKVVDPFDSVSAVYLPETDRVHVKAVMKRSVADSEQLQAFRQIGIQLPVWVGVQDMESSMPGMAMMKDEYNLIATGQPQTYEADIPADSFPRGRSLRLWPVAYTYSSFQEAPLEGSVPLELTTTPRSAWEVKRNWALDTLEAALVPRAAKDDSGTFGSPKVDAPPNYYLAAWGLGPAGALVPLTPPRTPALALSAGKESGFEAVWPMADLRAPLELGRFTELAFMAVVAGSEGSTIDSQGVPLDPCQVKRLAMPAPAVDPTSVALVVDASMGTAQLNATLRGVPSTFSVALLVNGSSEVALWASRDTDYDEESRVEHPTFLALLRADTGVQSAITLVVRDDKGAEVCRSAEIPVPLDAQLPVSPAK